MRLSIIFFICWSSCMSARLITLKVRGSDEYIHGTSRSYFSHFSSLGVEGEAMLHVCGGLSCWANASCFPVCVSTADTTRLHVAPVSCGIVYDLSILPRISCNVGVGVSWSETAMREILNKNIVTTMHQVGVVGKSSVVIFLPMFCILELFADYYYMPLELYTPTSAIHAVRVGIGIGISI